MKRVLFALIWSTTLFTSLPMFPFWNIRERLKNFRETARRRAHSTHYLLKARSYSGMPILVGGCTLYKLLNDDSEKEKKSDL